MKIEENILATFLLDFLRSHDLMIHANIHDMIVSGVNLYCENWIMENQIFFREKNENNWMKVEDEIPSPGRDVLFVTDQDDIFLGFYTKLFDKKLIRAWKVSCVCSQVGFADELNATHWRYVPDLPRI